MKEERTCVVCGCSLAMFQKNKTFCSAKCKMRDYRRKVSRRKFEELYPLLADRFSAPPPVNKKPLESE